MPSVPCVAFPTRRKEAGPVMWGTSCPHLVIPPHGWGQALSTNVQRLSRGDTGHLPRLWTLVDLMVGGWCRQSSELASGGGLPHMLCLATGLCPRGGHLLRRPRCSGSRCPGCGGPHSGCDSCCPGPRISSSSLPFPTSCFLSGDHQGPRTLPHSLMSESQ